MQGPIWSCEPAAAIVSRNIQKRSLKTVQSFELKSLQSEFYSSDEELQKEDRQEVPPCEEFELPAAKRQKNEDGSRLEGTIGARVSPLERGPNTLEHGFHNHNNKPCIQVSKPCSFLHLPYAMQAPSEMAEAIKQAPLTELTKHTCEQNTASQCPPTHPTNTGFDNSHYLRAEIVAIDGEGLQLNLVVLPLFAFEKYQSKDERTARLNLHAGSAVMKRFESVNSDLSATYKKNNKQVPSDTSRGSNKDVRQRRCRDQNSATSMAKSIRKQLAEKANSLANWNQRSSKNDKQGVLVQDNDITTADTIARFASQTPVQVNTVLIQQAYAFKAPTGIAANAADVAISAVVPVNGCAPPCNLGVALPMHATNDNTEGPAKATHLPVPEQCASPAKTAVTTDCDVATAAATVGDATEVPSTIQFGSDGCTDVDATSVAASNAHAPGAVMKACKTLTRVVRKMVPQFKGVTSSIDMLFGPFTGSHHAQHMTQPQEVAQHAGVTEAKTKDAAALEAAPTDVMLAVVQDEQQHDATDIQPDQAQCNEQPKGVNKSSAEISVKQEAAARFVKPSIILQGTDGGEVCPAVNGSSGGGAPFAHVEVLNSPGYDHLHGTPPGRAVRSKDNGPAHHLARNTEVVPNTSHSKASEMSASSPSSSLWARWCACIQPDVRY